LLLWSGIRENAFRAAYAVLADRQQQQAGKPLTRQPAVKVEAKPKLSRNLC